LKSETDAHHPGQDKPHGEGPPREVDRELRRVLQQFRGNDADGVPDEASQRGDDHRFGKELQEDVAAPGAERPPDADLAGTLPHGQKKEVGEHEAGHDQRDDADDADEGHERPGKRDEEADDVLGGEDAEIVGLTGRYTVDLPEKELQLFDAAFQILLILETRPDHVDVLLPALQLLHHRRDRHDDAVVDVSAADGRAALHENADNLHRHLPHGDVLSDGVFLAEELIHGFMADQGDVCEPPDVLLRDVRAFHHRPGPRPGVIGR